MERTSINYGCFSYCKVSSIKRGGLKKLHSIFLPIFAIQFCVVSAVSEYMPRKDPLVVLQSDLDAGTNTDARQENVEMVPQLRGMGSVGLNLEMEATISVKTNSVGPIYKASTRITCEMKWSSQIQGLPTPCNRWKFQYGSLTFWRNQQHRRREW